MNQKKLLVFHPTIAPYRIDYFNALYEAFDMKLVLWNKGNVNQNFTMEKLYSQLDFKPIMRTEWYGLCGLKLRKGIISEMRTFSPEIIMSCECGPITIMALVYKLLFNRRCRVVTMVDDSFDMVIGGWRINKLHTLAERIILPFLNNIVCVDPRVTKWMQIRFGKGITMPIISKEESVLKKYEELLPLSAKLVNQYCLIDKKIILYVGRLDPEKNVETLIKAFCQVCQPNYILVIVGSGKNEQELKRLAKNVENIVFTGRLEGDEIYAWYNIANVFVLPSLFEPFGAVTAEALYGGCYCLISKIAGSQCLIRNEVNGQLINPHDIDDISKKIRDFLYLASPVKLPLKKRPSLVYSSFERSFEELVKNIQNN